MGAHGSTQHREGWRAVSWLALLLCAGCSAIPQGTAPRRIGAGDPVDLELCVVPVRIALDPQDVPKEYRVEEVVDAAELTEEIGRWLEVNRTFSSVRVGDERDEPALREAWDRGEDLILELNLRDFATTFEGHNMWWLPNILNWGFWLVPAWFVAHEDYSLRVEADVVVRSVDSRRALWSTTLPVRVEGSFDEFDRGWQLFGFIWPNNDADNWRQIAGKLLPALRSQLGEALSRALDGEFRPRVEGGEFSKDMKKTLALVVGISHFRDTVRHPALPFAASDARAVSRALVKSCRLDPRHVTVLSGSNATRPALDRALRELRARARPGDQVLIYFAGYGARDAKGAARLLLYDADGAGAGEASLVELGQALSEIPGIKLVALDCGFDGKGRSIARGVKGDGADVASLLAADAVVLFATEPGSPLLTPQHLAGGLFTYHLVEGLQGRGDTDGDGRVTPAELFRAVHDRAVVHAAYFGHDQRPSGYGLEHPFELELREEAKWSAQ